MAVSTIKIPPGMFRSRVPYQSKNRWYLANRVRWRNGDLQPIGGWREREITGFVELDPATEVIRDMYTWTDNGNKRYYLLGSNLNLYVVNPDDVQTTITPDTFGGSDPNPGTNPGYGKGLYGRWLYGRSQPLVNPPGTNAPAERSLYRWKFDQWGEDVICGPNDFLFRGPLFYYDVDFPTQKPTPINNAPTDANSFVVTDQRIVMTIGASQEARLVRWSDREDFNQWVPNINNYAGQFILQGKGALIAVTNVLNQALILSETDAHVARFVGAPLVFGFDRVGVDCGPWSASSVINTGRFAMWPGRRTFWMYDGNLKEVPCDVQAYLADRVSPSNYSKAFGISIPQFDEIWWFYQSKFGTEVDSYVAYDYVENHWVTGLLDRTAGASGEVFTNPVMIAPGGRFTDHEIEGALVEDTYVETGALEIGDGEVNMAVSRIFPDNRTFGDVEFTLLGSEMPTAPEYQYGPYPYNNPVDTRAMGRQIRMRIDGLSSDWAVGQQNRFDVIPLGTGRR